MAGRARPGGRLVAPIAGVAAATAALALLAASPRASTPEPAPDGFDHLGHAAEVLTAGAPAAACTRCHPPDRRGFALARADHATCFGACHGPLPAPRTAAERRRRAPYPIGDARRPVCRACHGAGALARLEAGDAARLPPAIGGGDPEHALALPHAAHAGVPGGCRACHALPPAVEPRRDHAACAVCHASAGRSSSAEPSMSDCAACHTLAVGPVRAPVVVPGEQPVGARFNHRRHLARGARCDGCHAAVAASDGDRLPAPGKPACAACHDGRAAFSMIEPSCRRCHTAPAVPRDPRESQRRFAHRAHDGTGAPCARCHQPDGRPRLDHATCVGGGCHDGELAASAPTICGACHIGVEPWTAQHLDLPSRGPTELGARFSHRVHVGAGACERCHTGGDDGVASSSVDHATCRGAGCHDAGATPALDACAGCHVAGLLADHDRARAARRFSVRRWFRHAVHRVDGAGGGALGCVACHDVAGADALADVPTPAKARCARCHDGGAAFKLTGHGCARCHGVTTTAR